MRTNNQIKQEVEDSLLSGKTFDYMLKSNPTLYKDKIELLTDNYLNDDNTFNLDNINFDYKTEGIKFTGEPIIIRFAEDDIGNFNYYEALYISDFEFNGLIYISESNQIELKLEATIRIFARNSQVPNVNGWIEIPKIINVLDKDLFMIWDRKEKQNEIQRLENLLHITIKY
jgi:hypothetical protein